MKTRYSRAALTAALVALLGLAAGASSAQTTVYLAAREFTKTLPGATTPVPMWGFAYCGDTTFTGCTAAATAPGSVITVAEGGTLDIHLLNELQVPVSLVIPGQVEDFGGDAVIAGGRMQSFTREAAAGGGTQQYTFTGVQAGTYLYQSGTQPSIQVPMGLYGALVVAPSTSGCAAPTLPAYTSPDICYDSEALVVYSEIDPLQNQAVQDFVDLVTTDYPATAYYEPTYFLVNGAPYEAGITPDMTVGSGTLLLRLLNAGLRSHAAAIVGLEMTVRAEDGNVYPSPRTHSSTLLPAGKTLDATVTVPATAWTYPIYDRMLDLTNANATDGGLLAKLQVGGGGSAGGGGAGPTAGDDTYNVTEDIPLVVPFPGVLLNDPGATSADLRSDPLHGTLLFDPDGSFTYTPDPEYSGPDSFTYAAVNASGETGATVTLNVSFANDPPIANPDGPYTNNVGALVVVPAPGVLGNDTDVDGDALTVELVSGTLGLTLNPDGSFSVSGPADVERTFTYRVSDGVDWSDPATVTFTRRAPNGPTLTVLGPADEIVGQYRWVLEEDTTFHPVLPPGTNPPDNTLGLNFHRSYMPVVAQGCIGPASSGCENTIDLPQAVIDPTKHYFVSVLPANAGTDTGYTLGAAPIAPGQTAVTVRVNQAPVPTAQIHVLVFEDNSPTNGAPDGSEVGLGGFQINLEDAGGRYGATAGAMMFDAFGAPLKNYKDCGIPPAPDSIILTCPDGTALIKNLPPGKYGVSVVPPAGSAVTWNQTSTIEGKRIIDAWVKAGEPAYFQEFGAPGYHVFIGFVSPQHMPALPTGGAAVTGRVTNLHMSRPPDQTLWNSESRAALAHTTAWVGLNSAGGLGPTIAVAQADAEGYFSLDDIPDGSYQLVVWDDYLDQIIAFRNVTVNGGTGGALGDVAVFQWFSRLENHVFLDIMGPPNGIRDDEITEPGMPEQNVNIRFRDGSVYLGAPTDGEGYVPFDETFPFFHWQVAEVDFARHDATGVTVTVDGGGDVTGTGGVLNPQTGSPRTETGAVLTQAFQGFIGQTSVLEWGKKPYASGHNGGISGIVYYATTRAENDPRLAAGDPWEPGIPRATVRLYREITRQDLSTGLVFVAETTTDSWDDSLPTGCPGQDPTHPLVTSGNISPYDKCYDGLRNFNQVRPGVFDGGYAFSGIPAGRYVVEVIPPEGYEIVKEEDKNVDFGDVFEMAAVAVVLPGGAVVEVMPAAAFVTAAMAPEPGVAQPACVGPDHTVPAFLSLFPGQMIEAPFAGATDRPLCNRKRVVLNDRANGVADFHLFTQTPIAAHGVGMILDDTAQEFNPQSVQFGEKWAPPFVPVSFRDWTGREINRVYSDQFGRFNALLPSTFSANEPMFSGMSPSMMISCMNDPGPGGSDPLYNPVYGTFCYTLQYMPGTTTYLDTPVLPTAAFAAGFPPVDCAYPNGTPMIKQVNGNNQPGPWVTGTRAQGRLTIIAQGLTHVPNPAYEGPAGGQPQTIQRDYGFGSAPGFVTVGGYPLTNVSWSPTQITGRLPPAAAAGGQLRVTRGDNGRFTMSSITVHVGGTPLRVPGDHATIQGAIDAASPGQLILVGPGTYDQELPIVWKPVRLQGAGPGVTFINAAKVPTTKLQDWRTKLDSLLSASSFDPLPSQLVGPGGIEPDTFNTEQGAGITVVGKNTGCPGPVGCFNGIAARIDGFTIKGGDSAGAIYVNGWTHGLEVSNNIVTGNAGLFHGGIRVGVPFLEDPALGGGPPFGFNQDLRIHHNQITHNGGLGGAGGGVMLCTGTDGYQVTENWICGNFTQGHGAGIAHFGLSDGGLIAFNKILFNQSFNQGQNVHGGGLVISGEPVAAGLGLGAGNVAVNANLILGNQAGAGHGGGIRTQFVNGTDPSYVLTLTNNMVVNNVAGWAGGGISLQDTLNAQIVNNTVAHNDSTATVGAAFVSPTLSALQPAGIVSEPHSPDLAAALPGGSPTFSTPTAFSNNIIWQNRSFHYVVDTAGVGALQPELTPTAAGACDGGTPTYSDLGVIGGGTLSPTYSIVTVSTFGTGNTIGPPQFMDPYCNGARSSTLIAEVTTLQAAPALDEGGNFIDVRFGPISLTEGDGTGAIFFGNYHVAAGTNGTTTSGVTTDYDNQSRSDPADIGADEFGPVPPLP